MPTTANEALLDAAIQHQIDLTRYSNGVVRKMIALLNRVDADIFAELTAQLSRAEPSVAAVGRLESMLGAVRGLNAQAYAQLGSALTTELRDFVSYEAQYQSQAIAASLPEPVRVMVGSVSAEQVYVAALAKPFQGAMLQELLRDMEATRLKRVRQSLAQGFVEGKTTDQMVRALRGTRAAKYADGLFEGSRREAEVVVRTAVSHMAAEVRGAVHEKHKELVREVRWTATLDNRTSDICGLRDGKRYTALTYKPIGHQLPWLGGPGRAHFNCRSVEVPVLVSWQELLKLPGAPELEPSTRASMDGQVPADQTYAAWLKRQPAAVQDDVVGATRGKLLRSGGLTFDKFANDKGVWYDLDELRARNRSAFKKAGL